MKEYLRFQKNIFVCRRYMFCLRRFYKNIRILQKIYLLCKKKYLLCEKKIIPQRRYPLQKINHLHQKKKFICNRKYSSVTTSSAAEDSFFGCRNIEGLGLGRIFPNFIKFCQIWAETENIPIKIGFGGFAMSSGENFGDYHDYVQGETDRKIMFSEVLCMSLFRSLWCTHYASTYTS
jgi:hypothetical protein